jgi:hypothetical protein
MTKQNEAKRNFAVFGFAKQAKFRETSFMFRFVSCFAKQKKGCEMETLCMKQNEIDACGYKILHGTAYIKPSYGR